MAAGLIGGHSWIPVSTSNAWKSMGISGISSPSLATLSFLHATSFEEHDTLTLASLHIQ